MSHTFYDTDRNGNERELVAFYKFTEAEIGDYFLPSTSANVSIYKVVLKYKGMKREVLNYIPTKEIEKAEESILEKELDI